MTLRRNLSTNTYSTLEGIVVFLSLFFRFFYKKKKQNVLLTWTSAPFFNNNSTISRHPVFTARWRGLNPDLLDSFKLNPRSINSCTISEMTHTNQFSHYITVIQSILTSSLLFLSHKENKWFSTTALRSITSNNKQQA